MIFGLPTNSVLSKDYFLRFQVHRRFEGAYCLHRQVDDIMYLWSLYGS
jgi:hypothetical protein